MREPSATPSGPGGGPLVSIVVNNHDYEQYLRDAIDSALGQRYRPVEVVVVDDGSTDDSRAVIAGYGARVVPVLKANGGQGSAFNAGLAASHGEIVIFLDADDMLLPETVERVVAAWRPGVAKVQYRLRIVDADGHPEESVHPPSDERLPSGDLKGILLDRLDYPCPATSGNAYSRRALAQCFPIPEYGVRASADNYLNTVIPFFGEVVSIDEPLGYYRQHGRNTWANFQPSFEKRLYEEVVRALQREDAINRLARERGLTPREHLSLRSVRNASLRLALRVVAPEVYPRPAERVAWLAFRGLRATWTTSTTSVRRRVAYSTWFALLPVLPRHLAGRLAKSSLVRWRAERVTRNARRSAWTRLVE